MSDQTKEAPDAHKPHHFLFTPQRHLGGIKRADGIEDVLVERARTVANKISRTETIKAIAMVLGVIATGLGIVTKVAGLW
jgi:hypothetical protein